MRRPEAPDSGVAEEDRTARILSDAIHKAKALTNAYTSIIESRMDFDGFDWDDGNREKCKSHGMTLDEIESVFNLPVVILPDKEHSSGERRFRAIGTTSKGRNAFVVFTLRPRNGGRNIRPISARYMHRREVEDYEKDYPDV